MLKHKNPEIGQKFGKWTVKEEEKRPHNMYYLCECECGEVSWVSKYGLVYARSGGCIKCRYETVSLKQSKDLTGEKINQLTVIEKVGKTKYRRIIWLCECECGKYREVSSERLINKLVKNCGKCNIVGLIGGTKWESIKKQAEERNIDFNITKQEAWDIFLEQDGKCKLTGIDLYINPKYSELNKITASLDRIDSFKGYSKENCQWVHKIINVSKSKLNNEEYISLCYAVSLMNDNPNAMWQNISTQDSNKGKEIKNESIN
jgi:hypothetical protein